MVIIQEGRTALVWAANAKCTEVATLLLAYPGINVNLQADVSYILLMLVFCHTLCTASYPLVKVYQ